MFRLLLPYFGFGLLAVYALLSGRRLKAALLYIRQNAVWVAPITIYLIMMTPILWGSPAETFSPRQIYYLIGGIGLAAAIATTPRLQPILRVGGALSLIALIVCVELLARKVGLSWTDAIREFFGRGNLKFIIYDFFNVIFNSVDPGSAEGFSASTKNEVANVLLVVALLFRSASRAPHRDIVGMAFMALALGLLVMLNDRSVLIAAAGSLLIATAIGAVARPIANTPLLVVKIIALAGVLVVAIGTLTTDSGLFGTLNNRFSFNDYSTEARMSQYHDAFAMIEKHPLTGNGYFQVNGFAIHDAFLNAWAYGGLLAFLLVAFFYVAVIVRWISFLASVIRDNNRWVLPIAVEWVAALPFMPLFRVWLSGEGGVLKFGEWIALSAFFGCLLANEIRYRRLFRASVLRRMSTATVVGAGYMHSPAH
jgi:hypothetical protein